MRQHLILSVAKGLIQRTEAQGTSDLYVDRSASELLASCAFLCRKYILTCRERNICSQVAMHFLTVMLGSFDLTNPASNAGILGCDPSVPVLKPP